MDAVIPPLAPMPGYDPDYAADQTGFIWSKKCGTWYRLAPRSAGRVTIMTADGVKVQRSRLRLAALAWPALADQLLSAIAMSRANAWRKRAQTKARLADDPHYYDDKTAPIVTVVTSTKGAPTEAPRPSEHHWMLERCCDAIGEALVAGDLDVTTRAVTLWRKPRPIPEDYHHELENLLARVLAVAHDVDRDDMARMRLMMRRKAA